MMQYSSTWGSTWGSMYVNVVAFIWIILNVRHCGKFFRCWKVERSIGNVSSIYLAICMLIQKVQNTSCSRFASQKALTRMQNSLLTTYKIWHHPGVSRGRMDCKRVRLNSSFYFLTHLFSFLASCFSYLCIFPIEGGKKVSPPFFLFSLFPYL